MCLYRADQSHQERGHHFSCTRWIFAGCCEFPNVASDPLLGHTSSMRPLEGTCERQRGHALQRLPISPIPYSPILFSCTCCLLDISCAAGAADDLGGKCHPTDLWGTGDNVDGMHFVSIVTQVLWTCMARWWSWVQRASSRITSSEWLGRSFSCMFRRLRCE